MLGEAIEGLFSSEIAEGLNRELRPDSAFITAEVAQHLKAMSDQVVQLPCRELSPFSLSQFWGALHPSVPDLSNGRFVLLGRGMICGGQHWRSVL